MFGAPLRLPFFVSLAICQFRDFFQVFSTRTFDFDSFAHLNTQFFPDSEASEAAQKIQRRPPREANVQLISPIRIILIEIIFDESF